jgi:hypothetical protein
LKNKYEIRGNVTAIFIKRNDGLHIETLIDTKDLEKLKSIPGTWGARLDPDTRSFYARTFISKKSVYLHRFIMDTPTKLVVDHLNHNTLDNRKCNLRNCSESENQQNRKGAQANNKSHLRRVSKVKSYNMWKAEIHMNGKTKYLGCFETPEKAAQVAENARLSSMKYSFDFEIQGGQRQ